MPEKPFLDETTRPDDILAAYRWIVGRDPRSKAEIDWLARDYPTRAELRAFVLRTKGSLHEHLKSRFGAEKWVLAEVLDGKRMWLNLVDRHVSMGCLVGVWEPDETRFVRATLKPGQTFVDVGANLGWFSLVASECVGPAGRVHAFEPQARIFPYLARTIAENGLLGRILPYEMALSDHWGSGEMAWSPTSANTGRAWLTPVPSPTGSLGVVRVGVLDDIMAGVRVDFLKIDVEGAEGLVLRGARRILKESRPVVMIELLPARLPQISGVPVETIFDLFRELGYRGFAIGPDGLGPPVEMWPQDRTELNLAFLPQ